MKYLTKQCKLILAIIQEFGHMTAEEVYTEAVKQMPKIALGTVYRNLNELAQDGRIRKIRVPDGPDRFDKTLSPHEHIICPVCGKVLDLSVPGLDECLRKAVKTDNFDYALSVNARCSACRAAQ
ncbi:MAG: transcriptional repressor [Clostridia bacterium]|nr:transcriptional repressor [Clostridia bacterium]